MYVFVESNLASLRGMDTFSGTSERGSTLKGKNLFLEQTLLLLNRPLF